MGSHPMQPTNQPRFRRSRLLPALTLVAGLGLTLGGWQLASREVERANQARVARAETASDSRLLPTSVLCGGIFSTLLSTALAWSLVNVRIRAQAMAERMTENLRQTQRELARKEAQLRIMLEHTPVGISWVQDR